MKAISLFSGGLDSVLAMKLIKDQGIEVIAVNINTGFSATKERLSHMKNMCEQIGVDLSVLDVRDEFIQKILFDPIYGYGKNFNPCIDCHGFMFRYTCELLKKFDASFLISGEVLAQRPMSQNKDALEIVKKLSNCEELIVRPLSAKLLPPSKPELEGWIDREKLLDISGRSRKRQLALAKEIGLKDFEPPAGGCLLTEIEFSKRLRDFIKFDKLEVEDIDTLKFGRHFRLPNGAKLIVGRHKEDNQNLLKTNSNKFLKGHILNTPGPVALLSKNANEEDKKLAANIIVTYGKTEFNKEYEVDFKEFVIVGKKADSKQEFHKYLV